MAAGDMTRLITERVCVCSGGSTSSRMLGGRHGLVLRKSSRPTPEADD